MFSKANLLSLLIKRSIMAFPFIIHHLHFQLAYVNKEDAGLVRRGFDNFPIGVGREFNKAAKPSFAFSEFVSPFLHALF